MACDRSRPGAARTARPEFHQLEVFLKVVETKSFTAAGHMLGRTQPAISQAIARLEDIYGADLFERSRGAPLALTPVAEAILPTARQILDIADQQMRRAAATAQSRSGTLALGIFEGLASGPLRNGLAAFIAASPDVRLRLVEGRPSELLDRLTDRRLDLLITAFPPGLAGTVVVQEDLWAEPMLIVLPTAHPLACRSELSWEEIATLRLHLRSRESETSLYGGLLGPIASALECEEHEVSKETLIDIVSIGMGATIITKSACVERGGVVYRPISGDHDSITFRALWPRSDRNPLRHRLLSCLRKQMGGARQA